MAAIESGWPSNVLKRQRDWIGRSEGAYVDFAVKGSGSNGSHDHIRVFTTRIDTIYGTNAVVVAAEHPIVVEHLSDFSEPILEKIAAIRAEKLNPTDRETEVPKDGIDTGLKAINPFNGEDLPVWIGNYVMMDYGTGALMSVSAHDERDFEFAKKFDLPIKTVIVSAGDASSTGPNATVRERAIPKAAFTDYGIVVDSGERSGKTPDDAKKEMAEFAQANGFGEPATTYRLRDWGISRQRFWGSPIPIIYCDKCGTVPEKFENLPVRLPRSSTRISQIVTGLRFAKPTRWTRLSTRLGTTFGTPTRATRFCRSIRK